MTGLIVIYAEFGYYSKERNEGDSETILTESLNPKYAGGIQGKKKLRILIIVCPESITTEFFAML